MSAAWRQAAKTCGAIGALYTLSSMVGLVLLCLAFATGSLSRIDILFYRGLVLVALAGVVTYGLLVLAIRFLASPRLRLRDAFAATAVSLSLNLSFLVVFPVTVDRSISLFLLAQMAGQDRPMRAEEVTNLFTTIYVGERRQIERRLREQTLSGFLDQDGATYKINARGRRLVATSRFIGALFDSHAGLMDVPVPVAPALPQSAAPPSRPE